MAKTISIGNQDFASIREKDCFYIDKTDFIKQWWESEDCCTLITRPRRFGKTLNMSMLNYFFSNKYEGRGDLFEGLSIWEEEEYRRQQGTWPVIFLSFAAIKERKFDEAYDKIRNKIRQLYEEHRNILQGAGLSEYEKESFRKVTGSSRDVVLSDSLNDLTTYLYKYYGKKVIILLDEYDTPMQEAWMYGYWDEMAQFMRSLFNSTFKTNPYLERAVMTGITIVTKETIFSDLNHLSVVTTTSNKYETAFGFTKEEVRSALQSFGLEQEQEKVKFWYDGFTFGNTPDIYNPWSIISFFDKEKFDTYWSNTSSNGLINKLIQEGGRDVKKSFEELIKGNTLSCMIEEHIVFQHLESDESAMWSLLVAAGYLKVVSHSGYGNGESDIMPEYQLAITNFETLQMFKRMVKNWFGSVRGLYNGFITSLLQGDLEEMNLYMSNLCLRTFSYFDTGKGILGAEPERFYHGFVLGLLVELENRYILTSNRESGFGRYDIMLKPREVSDPAFILEFKIHNPKEEANMKETVLKALYQIEEKKYEVALLAEGIPKENIKKYGFAFEGKTVVIGENS